MVQTEGVAKIHPLGTITAAEQTLISAAIPELSTNLQTVRNLTCYMWLISSDLYHLQGTKYVFDKYKEEEAKLWNLNLEIVTYWFIL